MQAAADAQGERSTEPPIVLARPLWIALALALARPLWIALALALGLALALALAVALAGSTCIGSIGKSGH